MNKAQNYQELLAIANELHAGLSWWGYQYAYAPNPPSADGEVIYTGRITIGAIAEKAMKIRLEMKKNEMGFTTNEADSVYPFCKKVYCLYAEDKGLCNQANRLTSICRLFTQVIFWATHQHKWGEVWAYGKFETYPDIICKGLPGSIEGRPVKGGMSIAFMQNLLDQEDQGATYIPYPDGT